jgi:hypothetical protein
VSQTHAALSEERRALIEQIRALPSQLDELVGDLSAYELFTPFLAGEWTVAQNLHHLADTHMQHFVRLKLTLVEDQPSFPPFQQELWATHGDAADVPVELSLWILRGLHPRIAAAYERIGEADWRRTGLHPTRGEMSLDNQLRLTAGHGPLHLEQIAKTLAAGRK